MNSQRETAAGAASVSFALPARQAPDDEEFAPLVESRDDLIGRLALASYIIRQIQIASTEGVSLLEMRLPREETSALRTAAKVALDTHATTAITLFREEHREQLTESSLASIICGRIDDRFRTQYAEMAALAKGMADGTEKTKDLINDRTDWKIQIAISVVGGFVFGLLIYLSRVIPSPF